MSEYDKELQSDSEELEEAGKKLGRPANRENQNPQRSGEAAPSSEPDHDESPRRTR